MKELGKRKIYVYLLGLFFAFLFVCSLIAKGIYAAGLPQVETTFPISTSIRHEFFLEGSIAQGEERAQYVVSGLRVEKVFVREGDMVKEGDVLFQINPEDAEAQAEKLELDIRRLKLQIQDLQTAKDLESQKEALQRQRADEDYQMTLEEGSRQVSDAADDLMKAKAELEEHLEKKPSPAESSVSGADVVSGGDSFSYEQQLAAWESTKKALEEKIEGLERIRANTEYARDKALIGASRSIEDAALSSSGDNTLKLQQINLEALEAEYKKYEQICEENGMVVSDWDGILTTFLVSVGEKITDELAAKITDPSGGFLFKATLNQETAKYISQGDEGTLKLNGSSKELPVTITYLTENKLLPGSYDAFTMIEGTETTIGAGGVLTLRTLSERFPYCVPTDALIWEEENMGFSIYVMSKKEGILGTEYMVSKVKVKVLERNESYAAIESELVDENSEVVISHTKELGDGAVVRYKEW